MFERGWLYLHARVQMISLWAFLCLGNWCYMEECIELRYCLLSGCFLFVYISLCCIPMAKSTRYAEATPMLRYQIPTASCILSLLYVYHSSRTWYTSRSASRYSSALCFFAVRGARRPGFGRVKHIQKGEYEQPQKQNTSSGFTAADCSYLAPICP